jgi:soluble cytochrome b562
MATKKQKLTVESTEEQKNLQPFCEQAAIAAYYKNKAEELRPLASKELQDKLDSDPDTKDFTGTVIYLCEGQMYKIRVQRPSICNWREKNIKDPLLHDYKALMNDIDKMKATAADMEIELAKAHPKCISYGFTIAYMSK